MNIILGKIFKKIQILNAQWLNPTKNRSDAIQAYADKPVYLSFPFFRNGLTTYIHMSNGQLNEKKILTTIGFVAISSNG